MSSLRLRCALAFSRRRSQIAVPWAEIGLAIFLSHVPLGDTRAAATLTTLYSFAGADVPSGKGLVVSPTGTFYGAAKSPNDNGIIYALTPDPQHPGQYTFSLVRSFAGGPDDGAGPTGLLLVNGVLYGATTTGGHTGTHCLGTGCGTVFRLAPDGTGGWTETILHFFAGGADGYLPNTNLVFDGKGHLYGVTSTGGSTACGTDGCGTVFRLTAPKTGNGAWSPNIAKLGADGLFPVGVAFDSSTGRLFVTTMLGGKGAASGVDRPKSPEKCGDLLEELTKNVDQRLAFALALACESLQNSGQYPDSAFVPNPWLAHAGLKGRFGFGGDEMRTGAGDTYLLGTTTGGGIPDQCAEFGNNGCGMVYELVGTPAGKWTPLPIYSFQNLADGAAPSGTLSNDSSNNIYGTTSGGGTISTQCGAFGCGSAFVLSPPKSGKGLWSKAFTYKFTGFADGAGPSPNLVEFGGAFYGTTSSGGGFGSGTLFKITP